MNKLALFDIDWTLLRGRVPAHIEAFTHALRTVYGVNAHIKEIYPYEGKIDRQILTEVLEKKGFLKEEINPRLSQAFEAMINYFKKNFSINKNAVLPGVRILLEKLQNEGVYLALLTGNLEEIARTKLKKAGLNKFFPIGGFSNEAEGRAELVEIARKKAERQFALSFPKDSIFLIGDSPRDISCGKKAGVKTIGVATGPLYDEKALKESGADLVVKNFKTERARKAIIEFIKKK